MLLQCSNESLPHAAASGLTRAVKDSAGETFNWCSDASFYCESLFYAAMEITVTICTYSMLWRCDTLVAGTSLYCAYSTEKWAAGQDREGRRAAAPPLSIVSRSQSISSRQKVKQFDLNSHVLLFVWDNNEKVSLSRKCETSPD